MKSFKVKIPPTKAENDLLIIYKRGKNEFHELKTSKDDFYKSLRYYHPNETKQNDLIYIQDNIPFDIFEKFISSITSKEVEINEKNLSQFFYLCQKYEYEEFRGEIEKIMQKEPNSHLFTEQIKAMALNDLNSNELDESKKEEIIARNLDISIQNGFLNNFSLDKVVRILNSPKKVIKDHHLLFSFVIQTIQKFENEKLNENDRKSLSVLPSTLNFCEMTTNEIEKLFEIEKANSFDCPQNSKGIIQNFISNDKEMQKKIIELEQRMIEMEKSFKMQIENLEEELQNSQDKEDVKKQIPIQKEEEESEKKNDENNIQFLAQIQEEEENTKNAIKQLQQLFIAQNQISKEEDEDEEDNFEEEEEKKTSKNENSFEIKKFEFNENKELDGIIKYLSDKTGGNPHDNGTIEVTSNSICSPSCHPKNLLNSIKEDDYLPKSSELNAWVSFDFKNMEIQISKYSIKSSDFGQDYGHIKNWVIETSNNGKDWRKIDEHSDYSELNGPNLIKTFDVHSNRFSRYCRFRNTGEYWGIKEKWGIQFNSIEFYGSIKIPSQ